MGPRRDRRRARPAAGPPEVARPRGAPVVSKSRPQARRPVQVVVASLLLAGGLSGSLTGCGVAGTSFQPGVAARVGNDTITVQEVDSIASSYCSSIEKQLGANNQVVPQRYLRGGIAGQLALVSAARQLAARYD